MDRYLQYQKYCKNNSCRIIILKIAGEVTSINIKKDNRREEDQAQHATNHSDHNDNPIYKRGDGFLDFLYFVL